MALCLIELQFCGTLSDDGGESKMLMLDKRIVLILYTSRGYER